jgi:nucleotide-binding universal stress UspA family protein
MNSTAEVPTTLRAAVRERMAHRTSNPPGARREAAPDVSPIVAAVDGSDAGPAAAATAARLARELDAPLVFVFVRRGPSSLFAGAAYQRRLDDEFAAARRALDAAHAVAAREGITAEEEILEGIPSRRVREFADERDARLVVLGSRRRWIGPSVSRAVIRAADRPVVVAGAGAAELQSAVGARNARVASAI